MEKTLFRSIWLRPLMGGLSRLFFGASGWRIEGQFPPDKKIVIIGAPHTSNWDFPFLMLTGFYLRREFHWLVKDSVFKSPLGGLARRAGGIAIDRSHSEHRVEAFAQAFGAVDELALIIAPEGTRSKKERWKTGFWHIAKAAQVPVVPCWIDYPGKVVGIGEPFWPSEDLEADLKKMAAFYQPQWARHPKLYTPPLSES